MATRNTMHVEVVTAERELYNGEADELIAPGTEGDAWHPAHGTPLCSPR